MASDQGAGAKDEKNEERQADYQQLKNVKETVDAFAHRPSIFSRTGPTTMGRIGPVPRCMVL